jgi:outer membrane translocation and assembly module TamA
MIRGLGTEVALAIALTCASAGLVHAQPLPPPPAAPASPLPVAPPPPAAPLPDPAVAEPPPSPSPSPSTGLADGASAKDCAPPAPCDWLGNLGSLELSSVLRALSARHLTVEASPWGLPIGRILVHNDDVFAEKSFLQFFNVFHVTSKEEVVAREVILRRGKPWDQAKAEETSRRLRDPVFSSVAVVLPVRGEVPGTVDVLVVTRDIWSLRFNTNYRYQDSSLTFLAASLSENNFLGRRKVLSVAYDMDQGQVGIGPLYLDKNFLGRHIEVRTRVAGLFERDALLDDGSFKSEGSESSIDLSRPLWNLSEKWGAGVSFSHRFATERSFRGANLRTYDNPDTDDKEMAPWRYELRRLSLSASVVRQWGDKVKQRVGGGYALESQRPELDNAFPDDATLAAAFTRDVLPRSERISLPFVSYGLFTPRYRTLRNVSTYDLAEDAQLGPSMDASTGAGLGFLGSDNTFLRASASAGYAHPFGGDGVVRLGAGIATRLDGGELIDNNASAELRFISPTVRRLGRVVAEARFFSLWEETQNRFFTIGSDNGLRGFSIGEFLGERKVALQVEARSRPFRLAFFRLGGVLFYDAGGAASSFGTMGLHHNLGIGLRSLIPQLSRELMRFDFAIPLDGANAGKVRFISGFRSEF